MERKSRILGLLKALVVPVAAAAALLWFLTSVGSVAEGQEDQGRAQLERSLRRSAAACYAAEGVYPPTLDYIKDHYGLQIDEGKYVVYYEVFASNLMPEITVLER